MAMYAKVTRCWFSAQRSCERRKRAINVVQDRFGTGPGGSADTGRLQASLTDKAFKISDVRRLWVKNAFIPANPQYETGFAEWLHGNTNSQGSAHAGCPQ